MLTNLGSIPIFLLSILLMQILYSLIAKCTRTGSKINNFTVRKIQDFRWAGLNILFNEFYITICFSVIINLKRMQVTSIALGFNNVLAAIFGLLVAGIPIFLAVSLAKKWKHAPSKEHVEGGEQEDPTGTKVTSSCVSLGDHSIMDEQVILEEQPPK